MHVGAKATGPNWFRPELASIGADSGFAAERVWQAAERRRVTAYIPPQPTMLPRAGEEPTTEAQRQALTARSRCKSPAGIEAHRRRMADAEGVIGELKNQGTAARAQRRGTPHFHVQLLVNCAAVNCKRLADHAPQAQSGIAAAPQTAQSRPPVAVTRAAATQPATADPAGSPHSSPGLPAPGTTRPRSTEPRGRAQGAFLDTPLNEEARLLHVRGSPGDSVDERARGTTWKPLGEVVLGELELACKRIA